MVADEVTFVERNNNNSQPAENNVPAYGIPEGFEDLGEDDLVF